MFMQNSRHGRFVHIVHLMWRDVIMNMLVKSYYELKPLIPRHVQIVLHQWYTQRKRSYCKNWPIDIHAADIRPPWSQWPGNKRFALVLTHDVETAEGVAKCPLLMQMEEQLGF